MKNFPHQINDLSKLTKGLRVVSLLAKTRTPLNDENFGSQLLRNGIYTYRDKSLTIDEYYAKEQSKSPDSRGYLTVARDLRRFFELLGFISLDIDKVANLTPTAKSILESNTDEVRKELWRSAIIQLALEGTDGEISHPYRILLKLTRLLPGLETPKLMLVLEAENDTEEEFDRIFSLSKLSLIDILTETGTSEFQAANAVKILPGIAEQLNDILRRDNRAYPTSEIVITEDEITTDIINEREHIESPYKEVSSEEIARQPNIVNIATASIDLAEAIRIRQKRLIEHQEIVRHLAVLIEKSDLKIFRGKFDCLAMKEDSGILYEVKTLSSSFSDEEKQTIKGVGQLKYYKHSIVKKIMRIPKVQEVLVFSRKPDQKIIDFCADENIKVIWRVDNIFKELSQEVISDYSPKI